MFPTRHPFRTVVVAGALVALAGGAVTPVASASAAPAAPPDRLHREVATVTAAGATSAVVRVEDHRRTETASSGPARRGSARPAPVDGRFRVGSQTKAFVATVVLQLVAEHRLGLDDRLGDRLPGVLPQAHDVTVRQLLNHTSGVPEVLTTFPSPRSAEILPLRYRTWTAGELVDRMADRPLAFPPGTATKYSNTNYLLLGMVVEEVTGRPYAEAVEHRIVRPLHLRGTTLPGTDPALHGTHLHGYLPLQRDDGSTRYVDITRFNPTLLGAAGEIVSTTHDLNRFYGALLDGRLVPRHLLDQMLTPTPGSPYGLGLIARPLPCGGTAWGKDGDAPGYSSATFVSPTGREVSIATTWGTGDADDAVDALLDSELCR